MARRRGIAQREPSVRGPSDRVVAGAFADRLSPDSRSRLARLRRRLWLQRALRAAVLAIAAAALAVVAVQVASRLVAIETAGWLMAGVIGVVMAGWLVTVARLRPSLALAARHADRELGLRERLGTAVELAIEPIPEDAAAAELADRQLVDTRARLGPAELASR